MSANFFSPKTNKASCLALIASLLSFQIACKTESQKAHEIFADGKMPAPLFRAANQLHELRDIDRIVSRILADQKNPNLLKVAVIDNGIDIAHPDLSDQIAFDLHNGRIVGAGLDLMGDDRFASHNLIRGDYYAFGSQGVRNGRIVGPPINPLSVMSEMNDQFMRQLIARIKEHPELKKSLFNKINFDSFSIFGAHFLLTRSISRFDSEKYISLKKRGRLLEPSRKSSDLNDTDGKPLSILERVSTHYSVERPWLLNPENGTTMTGGDKHFDLFAIEGADQFHRIMTETFEAVKISSGYDRAFLNYLEFIRTRQFSPGKKEEDIRKTAIQNLAKAFHFKKYGASSRDPLRTLIAYVDALIVERRLSRGEQVGQNFRPSYNDVKSAFDDAAIRTEKLLKQIDSADSKTAEEARTVSQLRSKLGAFRELASWALKERAWERSSLTELANALPQNSLYRRHLVRTGHPFFADSSAESLHGSHVAGIIAFQDPNIRIVPIRVTTESTQSASDALRSEKASFKKRFYQWLMDPVVFRAFGSHFGSFVDGVNFADESKANKQKVSTAIMRVLDSKIEMAFDSSAMNFTFVEEVKKAIKYVGEKKVKIANVSLGMNFGKNVATYADVTAQRRLEAVFEFLQFEFFKHEIAVEAQKSAPNSLFVIAAGNDGQWVDGRSRTALPVDLSSPFLEKFENIEKGEVAPNNHVNNILGVGSLGPGHELSSFTNIILSAKTPFIMAEGENILSPVKSTSKDAHNQMLAKYLPEISDISSLESMALDDERLKEMYRAELTAEEKSNPELARRRETEISLKYLSSVQAFSSSMEVANLHMFLRYPQSRARLSGTSMATPTVVGILSRMIIEKAERLRVPVADLYDHPDFSPAVLIDDALARGKPLAGNLRGISLKMLTGDRKWDLAPKAQEAEVLLSGFIERGAKDNRLGPRNFRLNEAPAVANRAGLSVRRSGSNQCRTLFN